MMKRRIGWAVWLLAAALLYFFENNTGTRVLLAASVLLPLISALCAFRAAKRLRLDIDAPESINADSELSLSCRVTGGKLSPLTVLSCTLEADNLLTGEHASMELTVADTSCTLRPEHCGLLRLRCDHAAAQDVFGLFRFATPADTAEVLVLPQLYPVTIQKENSGFLSAQSAPPRPQPDAQEMASLRAYRPGDPLRQIHWKLSEKLNMPLVREAPPASACQVLLLLETVCDDAASAPLPDAAVTALLSVSQSLARAGWTHTICWMDAETQTPAEMAVSRTDDFQVLQDLLLRGCRHSSADGIAEGFCLLHPDTQLASAVLFSATPHVNALPLLDICGNVLLALPEPCGLTSENGVRVAVVSPAVPELTL